MAEPTGICALCGARVLAAELMAHLRGEHDVDAEIATWPDGEPVIVDSSLEPGDFDSKS